MLGSLSDISLSDAIIFILLIKLYAADANPWMPCRLDERWQNGEEAEELLESVGMIRWPSWNWTIDISADEREFDCCWFSAGAFS